jgi:hypothetical protein
MAKLANAFVVCPRDPGSNLSVDKYFLILFGQIYIQIGRVLTIEHYLLIYIFL